MHLQLLKKIGLLLGVLFLAYVILGIGLLTFDTFRNRRHKEIAESRMRPAVAFFRQEQINSIFLQTGKIYVQSSDTEDSWFSMRGYLYENKIFITNNHLYSNICQDGCKDRLIRLTNEYDIKTSFTDTKMTGLSLVFCHEQLDICAIDIAPGKTFQRKAVPSDSKQVFVVAVNSYSEGFTLAPGTISRADSPALIADLFAKPGYSGSPIFNSNGEAIAILSRGLGGLGIDSEPYMAESVGIRLTPILDLTECYIQKKDCAELVQKMEDSMREQTESYRQLSFVPLNTFYDRFIQWYRYRNLFDIAYWRSQ